MEADYAVTFEFDSAPPVTVRGHVDANMVRTVFARAVDEAVTKAPGARWRSMSVLLDIGGFSAEPNTATE